MAVWVCVWWWDERCDRFKKRVRVKLFRLSFRLKDPVEKVEFFDCGSASRNSQSKKVESKKPFFDCVRKTDSGFSRKRPFSTDKSDCLRNGQKKKRNMHICIYALIRTYWETKVLVCKLGSVLWLSRVRVLFSTIGLCEYGTRALVASYNSGTRRT